MKRTIVAVAVFCMTGAAWAEGTMDNKPAGTAAGTQTNTKATATTGSTMAPGQMDMTKMGPWARKPTNEAATKKEITEWFKKAEAEEAKGNHEMMMDANDFPVYMVTDDAKGNVETMETSKDQYTQMMKPFYENMPKDTKWTHKPTVTVLSDSLAAVVDEFTMTQGKHKMAGKNSGLLVKKDGQWKWKMMAEAGWGGMSGPGTGGSSGETTGHHDMNTMGNTGTTGTTTPSNNTNTNTNTKKY